MKLLPILSILFLAASSAFASEIVLEAGSVATITPDMGSVRVSCAGGAIDHTLPNCTIRTLNQPYTYFVVKVDDRTEYSFNTFNEAADRLRQLRELRMCR